jgi:hypothetical protein
MKSSTWHLRALDDNWKTKLLSGNFFVKEGNGNAIENALVNAGYKLRHRKIKTIILNYLRTISEHEFGAVLRDYQKEKDKGQLPGNWDPYLIQDKREFMRGFDFQGDYVTLSLLSRAIKIDFVLITSDYTIHDLAQEDHQKQYITFIYHDKTNKYFNSIVLKNESRYQAIFDRHDLPVEVSNIIDKNRHIKQHVYRICEQLPHDVCTLNNVIQRLETTLKGKLIPQDKQQCIKAIKDYNDTH